LNYSYGRFECGKTTLWALGVAEPPPKEKMGVVLGSVTPKGQTPLTSFFFIFWLSLSLRGNDFWGPKTVPQRALFNKKKLNIIKKCHLISPLLFETLALEPPPNRPIRRWPNHPPFVCFFYF
jgi:hypothetical protein